VPDGLKRSWPRPVFTEKKAIREVLELFNDRRPTKVCATRFGSGSGAETWRERVGGSHNVPATTL
jgi:hypothetical protein